MSGQAGQGPHVAARLPEPGGTRPRLPLHSGLIVCSAVYAVLPLSKCISVFPNSLVWTTLKTPKAPLLPLWANTLGFPCHLLLIEWRLGNCHVKMSCSYQKNLN